MAPRSRAHLCFTMVEGSNRRREGGDVSRGFRVSRVTDWQGPIGFFVASPFPTWRRTHFPSTLNSCCQCQPRTPVLLFRLPAALETGTVCAQPKAVVLGISRVRNSRVLGKARKDAGGLAGRRCDCPAPPPRAIAFQNRMTPDSRHHQNVGAPARITVDNRKTPGGSRG